jgi:glycosyltransferase involved in cell wall biosynthesis
MKITVSVSGKFSMGYLWAAYLERRGMLDRLITPVPYGRGARFGVSRERTRSLWPIGAVNWGMQHAAPRALQPPNQIAISASYDEAASRMLGDCDVFNGWASMSLRSLRAARRRGVPSVLQIASAHIGMQTELLAGEARRWRVDAPVTHPAVLARTLREYEEADVLAVPSEFVRRTFVERGVVAEKMRLVPWGVHPVTAVAPADAGADAAKATSLRSSEDVSAYAENELRLSARGLKARARLEGVARAGAEEDKARRRLTVLFVGAVGLRKGIPYLFEAWRQLDARATLRLVGPIDAAFVRAIGGLPNGVEAVGVKTGDALAAEFRDADVFVLPSIEDGYGVVTTEAMAAGLPVVVTANCGSADAVRDGENGFIVPACDASVLRDRLERLLCDYDLRERMSAAAAASVEGWSWEESGEAHLREIYERLLGISIEETALARTA